MPLFPFRALVLLVLLFGAAASAEEAFGVDLEEGVDKRSPEITRLEETLSKLTDELDSIKTEEKREAAAMEQNPNWGKWTDWSCCSVSCGKGREIRWRHCMKRCADLQTEMEEKICQLPACGGKLFGLINL